jgi:hypothetical protein
LIFPLYLFHFYHSNCYVREFHFCHLVDTFIATLRPLLL